MIFQHFDGYRILAAGGRYRNRAYSTFYAALAAFYAGEY